MSSLIISFVERSNHCIIASYFLILVLFSLWVLELMVILMTRFSSSKMEFACVSYDVWVDFRCPVGDWWMLWLVWVACFIIGAVLWCPPKEERNLQQRRTSITSNIENIIEDACELRFRWTRACIKMTISSKTHQEKYQTRTKKDDARMQWFELSMNDMIKLLIESPPW